MYIHQLYTHCIYKSTYTFCIYKVGMCIFTMYIRNVVAHIPCVYTTSELVYTRCIYTEVVGIVYTIYTLCIYESRLFVYTVNVV